MYLGIRLILALESNKVFSNLFPLILQVIKCAPRSHFFSSTSPNIIELILSDRLTNFLFLGSVTRSLTYLVKVGIYLIASASGMVKVVSLKECSNGFSFKRGLDLPKALGKGRVGL